jgi:hypothetical protein
MFWAQNLSLTSCPGTESTSAHQVKLCMPLLYFCPENRDPSWPETSVLTIFLSLTHDNGRSSQNK